MENAQHMSEVKRESGLTLSEISVVFLSAVLPILAIWGAVNAALPTGHFLLLLLMVLIGVLVLAACLSERLVPSKLYPILIVSISISLLYHALMISPNLPWL